MKRLTVTAAALAAGLFTVVTHSQAESDRFLAKPGLVTATKTKKPKVTATKEEKPKEAGAAARQKAKVKAASTQAAKKSAQRNGRKRINLEKPSVDGQTTAAVSRVRPELEAKARKNVLGLSANAVGQAVDKTKDVANAIAYTMLVSRYASAYGVPASLAHAVITVESNYRPDARGSAGEIGLMQIKPSTARLVGYSGGAKGLFDPETNIKFGMKYLSMAHQLAGGDTCGTILRYNAGHGAKRMNPVSAAYCTKVKGLL
jgi:soluble lytic murein transglycosylase-like protein